MKRTADLLARGRGEEAGRQADRSRCGAPRRRAAARRGADARRERRGRSRSSTRRSLYNKVMMDLRAVVEGYPGTEAAAFAWLNLALCAMHFSDFAGAHDYLQKAKAELPQRPGLSRGHRALLPRPGAREARLPAAGDRGLPRRGGRQGRDAHRQRRARGGAPGRAAGAARERRAGAPRLAARGRRARSSSRSTARRSRWAATRTSAIRVDEPLVSRRHARIERRGDGLGRRRPRLDQLHARERRARAPRARARPRRRAAASAASALSAGRPQPASSGRHRLGAACDTVSSIRDAERLACHDR